MQDAQISHTTRSRSPHNASHSPSFNSSVVLYGLRCNCSQYKLLCGDLKVSLFHRLHCHWAHVHNFICTSGTMTVDKCSHTSVFSLFCSVLHLQYKICILHATNAAKAWLQVDFHAQYNFLKLWASHKSEVGIYTWIVELFKHLFHAAAHCQNFGAWTASNHGYLLRAIW